MSATISRNSPPPEGFDRVAAPLPSRATSTSVETRLVYLTVATRVITVSAGALFGLVHPPPGNFTVSAIVLLVWTALASLHQIRAGTFKHVKPMTIIELVLTVGAVIATGGFTSPFILTPITGLLMAGYVWGRRATVGSVAAAAIAAGAAMAIHSSDAADQRAAGLIAVLFMLCGALGAFNRTLVVEFEAQRAAAIDQATQMATANDLLVSLHALAQTLPASFDLGEVVESIRQRVRALFPYTALVVIVPDDAGAAWRCELSEGVRVPTRLGDEDLPSALRRATTTSRPVTVGDRLLEPDQDGFAPPCRSGLYVSLRARGALVGAVAIEHEPPNAYGAAERDLLESLSGVLALSLDNARWFGRLHTLGAEAERGRIARELHDRVAQSLAYVTFELERIHDLPGDKTTELDNLHDVVRDIMQELRETIFQLRANVSEVNELSNIAADYLARFEERTGIVALWAPEAVRRLPYRVEQELWRIVQEALANVDRHSGAGEVTVRWHVDNLMARLEVTDNGRGFDPGRVEGDHYGIVGMRERADAVGARLRILSAPGRGTSVVVELETPSMTPVPVRRTA
jgi:signal transduction histidine kinase